MSIVLIIMMLVAVFTESPEQIENFLGGCITGNRDPNDPTGLNCTTLTLTKIKDVPPPIFTPPAFGGFNYEFCNEVSQDEDGREIRLYDSKPRYPEDWVYEDYNFTTLDCKDGEMDDVWFVSFGDMMSQLGAGIIIQPIVSFLQHIALAKSFSKKPPQYQVDTTQELFAYGTAQIANSFVFGIIPITSVVSRATVMWSAGKSMLATWLTAGLIYVAIIFLSDLFVYIPAAALAGVVIIAASSLFQPMEIKRMWYACPIDLIPFFFTFFFTLRSSSTGLIVGIFCHLIIALGKFIMPIDRPSSHENTIYLEGSIMFPSGDALSEKIQRNAARLPPNSELALDFSKVLSIDGGATVGVVDGISFSMELDPTLRVKINNIKERELAMLQNNGLTEHAIINGEPQVVSRSVDDLDLSDVQLNKKDLEANESKRSSISSGKSSHFSVNSIENKVRKRPTYQLQTADL